MFGEGVPDMGVCAGCGGEVLSSSFFLILGGVFEVDDLESVSSSS